MGDSARECVPETDRMVKKKKGKPCRPYYDKFGLTVDDARSRVTGASEC